MSIIVDGITLQLADYLGTNHTENEDSVVGSDTGETYPEQPLWPDRSFQLMLNLMSQGWTPTVVDVSGTSKLLTQTDCMTIQKCENASAQTLTLQHESNSPAPNYRSNAVIVAERHGAGGLTLQAEVGVTLNGTNNGSLAVSAQWGQIAFRRIGANAWIAAAS